MKDWNPGTLLKLSGSYWQTCTLHTGVKLEIFTWLGSTSASAKEIASGLGLSPRETGVLLNALTAMGLLNKENETFSNTDAALQYLTKDAPSYIGYMILHHHHLADSWVHMDRAVTDGGPIRKTAASSDPRVRESFLLGMFNNAMAMAPGLAKTLDLSSYGTLLDLGGGPGTYGIQFCLAHPGLSAVIFDLPTTKPFAQKIIKRFKVEDRVSFVPGDYTKGDLILDQTFDAAWLSHILHGEGPETAEAVIGRAVKVLRPGAGIFIHDFILDDSGDSPLFPALFSLNMMLGTSAGKSYTQKEIEGMLSRQGVKDIRRLEFKGPTESGIIFGITP